MGKFGCPSQLLNARNFEMPGWDKVSEKWPWNGEFLRLFLLVPSISGITAAVATYPSYGPAALWFLFGIPIGASLYGIYGSVGRRVESLKEQYSEVGGELAEALIVVGKIQSPGIVAMNGPDFEMIPIVGNPVRINNAGTKLIGEGHWLPGKYVWGKRAFTFRKETFNPLAFAVAESVGTRWSQALKGKGKVL